MTGVAQADGDHGEPAPKEPAPKAAKAGYHVEAERQPCGACSNGGYWLIVGEDDVAVSVGFDEREEADDLCELLNDAYLVGYRLGYWDARAAKDAPPEHGEPVA